jgi:hypothetical protein
METDAMIELSQEFAELGKELCGPGDNSSALQRLVQLAVKHVAGCAAASITIVRNGNGRTIAASDPIAGEADSLQYGTGEGPCLSAAEDDANYLVFDVEHETRWPLYIKSLKEQTAVRSVLSFRLLADRAGALNLFALEPAAFDEDAIDTATIFSAHASSLVALYEAEAQVDNLEAALNTNREIGTAIGVLMAHRKVTREAAFDLLRTSSQRLHRKLRDVAVDVVETGTLPGPAGDL